MNRKLFLVVGIIALSAFITACGTTAIPEYEQAETSVAVAQESTQDALIAQGDFVPTETPTIDFAATEAAIQATADFEATEVAAQLTAEFNATNAVVVRETVQAAAVLRATVNAQAILDAEAAEAEASGADDPLFEAVSNADVANGEALFAVNAVSPCTACHSLEPDVRLVGPSQYNLFARTIERIENGMIEDEGPYSYIYNSVVHPNDYIVEADPPYPPGVMPQAYGDQLSEDDLYDLVAYMVTIGD